MQLQTTRTRRLKTMPLPPLAFLLAVVALLFPLLNFETAEAAMTQTGQPPLVRQANGAIPQQAQQCQVIEDPEPPFRVVNPYGSALERSAPTGPGTSAPAYFPQGTIVKLEDEDFGRVPLFGTRFPKTLAPRVRVLSVPSLASSVEGSTGQFRAAESQRGKRATPGSVGFINVADLTPLVGSVSSPANVIFQVRRESPMINAPELKGRPVRLAYDGSNYLIQRCCPQGVDQNAGLTQGTKYKRESAHNPACRYSPVFDLLKPIDHGRGTALEYQVERRIAPGSCDAFVSSLSPVSRDNQRAAFMLSQALSQPGATELQRLQQAASKHALRGRQTSRSVGRGIRSGNQSKGMCKQAVNDFLVESGMLAERIPGDHAYMAKPYLQTKGFENVLDRVQTSKEAPAGSILVYEKVGGGSGHIEVKVDNSTYCSDYCKDAPIDAYLGARKLVAIYVKKKVTP